MKTQTKCTIQEGNDLAHETSISRAIIQNGSFKICIEIANTFLHGSFRVINEWFQKQTKLFSEKSVKAVFSKRHYVKMYLCVRLDFVKMRNVANN
jgi:hypothetical protein